ncbi:hypothetical protein RJT34_04233 [Clitoria ternatea]|uniref:GTD-binding domain-containing protein n=1 Tax=Clitoria ternatea TaxID=43366 RepID=A0AAN9KL81_CLITE
MDFLSTFHFLTEFGCSFVLLRSLFTLLNYLGIFMMLTFCFKVLRFGWYSKSALRFLCDSGGVPTIRFCFENLVWAVSKPKAGPLQKGRDPKSNLSIRKRSKVAGGMVNVNSEDGSGGKGVNVKEVLNEDEVFDVMTLRKMAKIERRKANAACAELEKERTAAASSAEEAMAMILRLQSEKSTAEIQANQFRRMAEQKLDYDQEVIESLQWVATQRESRQSSLEDQMEIYMEQLKQFLTDDDIAQIGAEIDEDFGYDDDRALDEIDQILAGVNRDFGYDGDDRGFGYDDDDHHHSQHGPDGAGVNKNFEYDDHGPNEIEQIEDDVNRSFECDDHGPYEIDQIGDDVNRSSGYDDHHHDDSPYEIDQTGADVNESFGHNDHLCDDGSNEIGNQIGADVDGDHHHDGGSDERDDPIVANVDRSIGYDDHHHDGPGAINQIGVDVDKGFGYDDHHGDEIDQFGANVDRGVGYDDDHCQVPEEVDQIEVGVSTGSRYVGDDDRHRGPDETDVIKDHHHADETEQLEDHHHGLDETNQIKDHHHGLDEKGQSGDGVGRDFGYDHDHHHAPDNSIVSSPQTDLRTLIRLKHLCDKDLILMLLVGNNYAIEYVGISVDFD